MSRRFGVTVMQLILFWYAVVVGLKHIRLNILGELNHVLYRCTSRHVSYIHWDPRDIQILFIRTEHEEESVLPQHSIDDHLIAGNGGEPLSDLSR